MGVKKIIYQSWGLLYEANGGTAVCTRTMPVLQGGQPRALQRQSLASLRAPIAARRKGTGCVDPA